MKPAAIIALLDRREAAEKVCEAAEGLVNAQNVPGCVNWYDNSLRNLRKALQEWQKGVGGK